MHEKFALIAHNCEQGTFRLTFSAGLSSFPACDTAGMLAKAADEALYWAKEVGRNQVRRAEVCNRQEKS